MGPGQPWYAILPLYLGYASVPVCTGIAILRYRLYDIDVIISRAFMLAVLATFVTVGYVAVVVAIGAVLGGAGRRAVLAVARLRSYWSRSRSSRCGNAC